MKTAIAADDFPLKNRSILLRVFVRGLHEITDETAREAAKAKAVKPFLEANYSWTDLEGDNGGEQWVLLLRND